MEKKRYEVLQPFRAIERGTGNIVVIDADHILAYPPVDGVVTFESNSHIYSVSEKAFLHSTQ
jgi:hypothetical protein